MAKRFMAEGDLMALSWIILGTGLLCPSYTLMFLIFLILFSILVFIYKYALELKGESPGLPIITGSFFITGIIYISGNGIT